MYAMYNMCNIYYTFNEVLSDYTDHTGLSGGMQQNIGQETRRLYSNSKKKKC